MSSPKRVLSWQELLSWTCGAFSTAEATAAGCLLAALQSQAFQLGSCQAPSRNLDIYDTCCQHFLRSQFLSLSRFSWCSGKGVSGSRVSLVSGGSSIRISVIKRPRQIDTLLITSGQGSAFRHPLCLSGLKANRFNSLTQ